MALLAAQRASFVTGARRQARVAKASNGSKVTMSRNLWLPGSTPPAHLDGSMPADYGASPRCRAR
jgi:light-harvesting complex I chlorophyll a/b binding protein 4